MHLGPDYNHIAKTVKAFIRNPRIGIGSVKGFMTLDWKRLLNRQEIQVLGLDIGSSTIKMVELSKDRSQWSVTAAGIVDIADGTENNNTSKEINTISAISECLRSSGSQTQLVVCGVSGPEVAVRCFKFPMLPRDEIEGAVMLEAAQVCPFNVTDGVVDYQVIPNGENNVRGVLVAATNKLIESKRHLAKEASLNSILMDVDGLALLNCLSECEQTKANRTTTAILNVGSSYTNLAIIGDDSLPFIRDMTYAGNDVVKEIATANSTRPEIISRILKGHENSSGVKFDIGESLAKACRKLIVDVTDTLRYYAAQEKSAAVEKVFVCGGFALVKGFVELLDNHLPTKAVLWNPFDKIRCDAGQNCRDMLQKNGPLMAVATGLAMRSI
ncbi:MAG: type IV pilus assembly protein PilM [Planctomycetota bacterium]|nr:MAG: type IV pilus assembly protein PilM [Planctomycetota bacterium]